LKIPVLLGALACLAVVSLLPFSRGEVANLTMHPGRPYQCIDQSDTVFTAPGETAESLRESGLFRWKPYEVVSAPFRGGGGSLPKPVTGKIVLEKQSLSVRVLKRFQNRPEGDGGTFVAPGYRVAVVKSTYRSLQGCLLW
jgi:hypothetical protein